MACRISRSCFSGVIGIVKSSAHFAGSQSTKYMRILPGLNRQNMCAFCRVSSDKRYAHSAGSQSTKYMRILPGLNGQTKIGLGWNRLERSISEGTEWGSWGPSNWGWTSLGSGGGGRREPSVRVREGPRAGAGTLLNFRIGKLECVNSNNGCRAW